MLCIAHWGIFKIILDHVLYALYNANFECMKYMFFIVIILIDSFFIQNHLKDYHTYKYAFIRRELNEIR